MEELVTFEQRNKSSVPYFNGLAIVIAMMENKRRYFCHQALKKQQKTVPLKTYIVLFIISHVSV
jgi:hypothetical protein